MVAVLLATNCFVLRQRHRFSPRCDWNAGAGISRIEPKGNVYYNISAVRCGSTKNIEPFWYRLLAADVSQCVGIFTCILQTNGGNILGCFEFSISFNRANRPRIMLLLSLSPTLPPPPIFASPQNRYHFLLFMPQRWIALRQCDTHKLILNLLHFLFKMTSDSICLGLGK